MNKLTLLAKHLWLDAADTRRAIPPDMVHRLAERVAASEQRHSGQIRICIEAALPASYLWRLDDKNTLNDLIRQRAVMMFSKLRVWDTEHNNGVLIYVLLAEHAIEIVADRGLMRHVDATHWQSVVSHMASAFREKRYEDGLTQALEEASTLLVAHFVRTDASASHPNELPDTPLLQ
ncbi:TPM domain-containing protein [Polaromonas hydrogenivorans]|uniref:TPM domain-containing protein n=1 Tax=Polaromonas hydrogenivorans TaxID=335476 RepID=A0AAU7LUE1_9BURK